MVTFNQKQIGPANMTTSRLTFVLVSAVVIGYAQAMDSFKVNIDYKTAPKLESYIPKVKAAIEDYYPKLADYLATPSFTPPAEISLTFDGACEGQVSNWGTNYRACAKDLQKNGIRDNDISFLVMFTGQSAMGYPKDTSSSPKWLRQCLEQYGRLYRWEATLRPKKPAANKSPKTSSSEECSYFLNYVNTAYPSEPDAIQKLSKSQRESTYKDADFVTITGKTGKELWADMQAEG